MSGGLFDSEFEDMPTVLPVLPFAGSFLFPRCRISLRLFETRYMKLVFNALASSRMIGMVQPVGDTKDFHKIGCAGRISSFTETEDDVLLVTLYGVSRFEVVRELPNCPVYRMVESNFKPFKDDFSPKTPKIDREKLFSKLDRYAYSKKIDLNSAVLKKEHDETLLTTIASLLPFERMEKQALLEAKTHRMMLDVMMMLLESDFGTKSN